MRIIFKLFILLIISNISVYALNYNSNWTNKDPNTKNIKSIYINSNGLIQVVGSSCKSKNCNWGSTKYTTLPNGLIASWKYEKVGHKVVAISTTNTNEIKVVTKYLYFSNREDLTIVDYFVPAIVSISARATLPQSSKVLVSSGRVVEQRPAPKVEAKHSAVAVAPSVATRESTITSRTTPSEYKYFIGKWVEDDPYAKGLTRLEVSPYRGKLYVRVWGRGVCYPKECNWGKHELLQSGDSYITRWMQGSIDKTLNLNGLVKNSDGGFQILRAKITNYVKAFPGPKVRNSYLRRVK